MKWNLTTTILLLVSLIIGYLAWQNWISKKTIQSLQITSQKRQVDTLEVEVEKKVTEWKTREVRNNRITEKWNNIHDTILMRDTLLVEAKKDIQYLGLSNKKCDTALSSCLSYSKAQKELIKALESKKTPIIVPYAGVGLSMDKNLLVTPAAQVGIGINLNKIFGKK